MRRRDEAADEDQSRYAGHRRSQVQDLRLRLGDCQLLARHGMGQRQDGRGSALDQEHGHRARAFSPAGKDSLLRACRRRHQGGHRRLEEEARHRSARCRKSRALGLSFRSAEARALAFVGHDTLCSLRDWARPNPFDLWSIRKMATEVANPTIAKISLSERAAKKIRELLEKEGVSPEKGGLRVGVQGGGCSGLSYAMRLDTQARDRDKIFEEFGARLFVDPKSFLYLNGTTLEYEETLMRQGFVFQNPNAARNCGCGSSFTA